MNLVLRRIREDFLKQEVIKHLNHWFSNFRETSDSLGLRLAKNFHFERAQHMIIMQRFSEYSLKNIYLSHIVVPFPFLFVLLLRGMVEGDAVLFLFLFSQKKRDNLIAHGRQGRHDFHFPPINRIVSVCQGC